MKKAIYLKKPSLFGINSLIKGDGFLFFVIIMFKGRELVDIIKRLALEKEKVLGYSLYS